MILKFNLYFLRKTKILKLGHVVFELITIENVYFKHQINKQVT